jgi:hypothetical protein
MSGSKAALFAVLQLADSEDVEGHRISRADVAVERVFADTATQSN